MESLAANAGDTLRDRDDHQAAAAGESPVANAFHALWKGHLRQGGAAEESRAINIRDAFLHRYTGQAGAAIEGAPGDVIDTGRNRHACQAFIAAEGKVSDGIHIAGEHDVRDVCSPGCGCDVCAINIIGGIFFHVSGSADGQRARVVQHPGQAFSAGPAVHGFRGGNPASQHHDHQYSQAKPMLHSVKSSTSGSRVHPCSSSTPRHRSRSSNSSEML